MAKWEIWHRWQDEPVEAYKAFAFARDNPDQRDLAVVAQNTGKAHGTVKDYSSNWQWTNRLQVYDVHVSIEKSKVTEEEILEQHRENIRALQKLIQTGVARLEDFQDPDTVPPGTAKAMITDGVKTLRLELDQSTENVAVQTDIDLSKLSPEELRVLDQIRKKIESDG